MAFKPISTGNSFECFSVRVHHTFHPIHSPETKSISPYFSLSGETPMPPPDCVQTHLTCGPGYDSASETSQAMLPSDHRWESRPTARNGSSGLPLTSFSRAGVDDDDDLMCCTAFVVLFPLVVHRNGNGPCLSWRVLCRPWRGGTVRQQDYINRHKFRQVDYFDFTVGFYN